MDLVAERHALRLAVQREKILLRALPLSSTIIADVHTRGP